jgi:hypothetical protein
MEIISRSQWGARWGPNAAVSLPYTEVILHTVAGSNRAPSASYAQDVQHIRNIESYHRNQRNWPGGIGYNFVIMRSGRIFEGQGWGRRGTHTENRNSQLGVCFDGHGDQAPATDAQWASAEWLLREGLRTGKLRSGYRVSGHRDYSQKGKTCPGTLIYPHIGRLRGLTAETPTPPPPEDEMTPEQEAKLDAVDKKLDRVLAAIDGTERQSGHLPILPQLSAISAEVVGGEGSRSMRKLSEMIWNALYTGDGKLKPVIARFLD